jgi:hypothetical protein
MRVGVGHAEKKWGRSLSLMWLYSTVAAKEKKATGNNVVNRHSLEVTYFNVAVLWSN